MKVNQRNEIALILNDSLKKQNHLKFYILSID